MSKTMADVELKGLRKVIDALNTRDLRNTFKTAYRKHVKAAKKIAAGKLRATGIKHAAGISRSIRTFVYSRGGGFMISTAPRNNKGQGRVVDGFYKTKRGVWKPVAMWFNGGTRVRYADRTSRAVRVKVGKQWRMVGSRRGAITATGFMAKAEPEIIRMVETDMLAEIESAARKRLQKNGIDL